MNASAKVRHQQEFTDRLGRHIQRHHKPLDLDVAAVQGRLDRRFVPSFSHRCHRGNRARIGVAANLTQVQVFQRLHGVPVFGR